MSFFRLVLNFIHRVVVGDRLIITTNNYFAFFPKGSQFKVAGRDLTVETTRSHKFGDPGNYSVRVKRLPTVPVTREEEK